MINDSEKFCAKNDLLFKKIFGDPKNKECITEILQQILDIPKDEYEDIQIIDPIFKIEEIGDKIGILDVKLHTKNKKVVDVEVQVYRMQSMKKRIIYYLSEMIKEQLGSGEEYSKIKKVVSIIISTDYDLIEDSPKYHNKYVLHDKNTGSTFTDLIEVNILELQKIPQEDNSLLATWLRFLNTTNEEELKMCAEASAALNKAVCTYKVITSDERERMLLRAREKAWRDEAARFQAFKEDTFKEGAAARNIEIARNALSLGLNIEQISKITGLSSDEINSLMYREK
jgi:predicted transposase/invertase (TIGR01784 family)